MQGSVFDFLLLDPVLVLLALFLLLLLALLFCDLRVVLEGERNRGLVDQRDKLNEDLVRLLLLLEDRILLSVRSEVDTFLEVVHAT